MRRLGAKKFLHFLFVAHIKLRIKICLRQMIDNKIYFPLLFYPPFANLMTKPDSKKVKSKYIAAFFIVVYSDGNFTPEFLPIKGFFALP